MNVRLLVLAYVLDKYRATIKLLMTKLEMIEAERKDDRARIDELARRSLWDLLRGKK